MPIKEIRLGMLRLIPNAYKLMEQTAKRICKNRVLDVEELEDKVYKMVADCLTVGEMVERAIILNKKVVAKQESRI